MIFSRELAKVYHTFLAGLLLLGCLFPKSYSDDVAPLGGRFAVPEAEPVAAFRGLAQNLERAGVRTSRGGRLKGRT
jgi:hypothetical protein